MGRLGSVILIADRDAKAGELVTIYQLFNFTERAKGFKIFEDVKRGETKITARVDKVGTVEALSNITKRWGDELRMNMLVPFDELNKPINVEKDIKKGDKLEVRYEAIS